MMRCTRFNECIINSIIIHLCDLGSELMFCNVSRRLRLTDWKVVLLVKFIAVWLRGFYTPAHIVLGFVFDYLFLMMIDWLKDVEKISSWWDVVVEVVMKLWFWNNTFTLFFLTKSTVLHEILFCSARVTLSILMGILLTAISSSSSSVEATLPSSTANTT